MSDPEVAGPGVIVGFILTGALTLAASNTTLWLRRLKTPSYRRTFQEQRASNNSIRKRITAWTRLAGIDITYRILDFMSRLMSKNKPKDSLELWTGILEEFVLALSDQQLVTGLLVLVSGFAIYLPNEDIHFNLYIAGDLAFFSSITHASTLMTLRPYLREHKKMTKCRIFIVYSTLALWICQAILYLQETSSLDYSTLLSFQFSYGSQIAEIIGIVWMYWDVCIPLIISEDALEARAALSRPFEDAFPDDKAWISANEPLFRFYKYYTRQKSSMYRGFLWIILELIFPWYSTSFILFGLFAIGLANLALDIQGSGIADVWGFGQLLPTFLILLPIFNILENFTERHKRQDENQTNSSQGSSDALEMHGGRVEAASEAHNSHQSPNPGSIHRTLSRASPNPLSQISSHEETDPGHSDPPAHNASLYPSMELGHHKAVQTNGPSQNGETIERHETTTNDQAMV